MTHRDEQSKRTKDAYIICETTGGPTDIYRLRKFCNILGLLKMGRSKTQTHLLHNLDLDRGSSEARSEVGQVRYVVG